MTNKRYIEFNDEDVILGYDYVSSRYYVISQASSVHATSTYRKKEDSILQVLLSLGITELPDGPEIAVAGQSQDIPNPEDSSIVKSFPVINPEAIDYLKDNLKDIIEEFIPPGFYTIEEDGSYVRTIQFNKWKDYPLTVNCAEGNVSIRNSNILYSLDIKEDPTIRIRHFCTFYLEKLGLHIEEKYMRGAYYFLVNQYLKPNFYNKVIQEDSGALAYDNNFFMANFNDKSPVVCNGTRDPYGEDSEELELSNIILIDSADNYVYLQDDIQEDSSYKYNLREGFKVRISNSSYEADGTNYSADGDYTVDRIDSDGRTIFLKEPIKASVEAPKCFVQSDLTPIVSMSRDDKKIIIGSVPNNVIIGDTIHVTGANVVTEHEVISCDGSYTVTDITDQIQQIKDEVISTTASSKEIKLSADSTVLSVGDVIELKGTSEPSNNGLVLTIVNIDTSNNVVLTVEEDIADSTDGTISCQKYLYSNIYTEEAIPTNYPNGGSSEANLYKEVFVGDIASVTNGSINLLDEPPSSSNVRANNYLYLYDLEGGPYKCQATGEPSGKSIPIQGLEDEIKFPSLSYLNPSQVIKLNVTSVAEYLEDSVETGEFLLSNFKECQSYVDTLWLLDYNYTGEYSSIPSLNDSIGDNLYQEIRKTLVVPYRDTHGVESYLISFEGVYSEVYKDEGNG